MIPRGLCQCGCGSPTSVITENDKSCGLVRGEYRRYVASHSSRIVRRGYVNVRVAGESRGEHVVVAERVLGRPLPTGAVVHHVDGNVRNNATRNLVICENHEYHMLLHVRQRVRDHGGDPNTDRFCSRCKRCKPFAEFNRRTAYSIGYQKQCRTCQRDYFRGWSQQRKAARSQPAPA